MRCLATLLAAVLSIAQLASLFRVDRKNRIVATNAKKAEGLPGKWLWGRTPVPPQPAPQPDSDWQSDLRTLTIGQLVSKQFSDKRKEVLTTSGRKGVPTTSAKKSVLTTSATKGVLTTSAKKGVLPTTAKKGVLTTSGTKGVLTTSGTKGVLTTSAKKGVLTTSGTKGVLTTSAKKAEGPPGNWHRGLKPVRPQPAPQPPGSRDTMTLPQLVSQRLSDSRKGILTTSAKKAGGPPGKRHWALKQVQPQPAPQPDGRRDTIFRNLSRVSAAAAVYAPQIVLATLAGTGLAAAGWNLPKWYHRRQQQKLEQQKLTQQSPDAAKDDAYAAKADEAKADADAAKAKVAQADADAAKADAAKAAAAKADAAKAAAAQATAARTYVAKANAAKADAAKPMKTQQLPTPTQQKSSIPLDADVANAELDRATAALDKAWEASGASPKKKLTEGYAALTAIRAAMGDTLTALNAAQGLMDYPDSPSSQASWDAVEARMVIVQAAIDKAVAVFDDLLHPQAAEFYDAIMSGKKLTSGQVVRLGSGQMEVAMIAAKGALTKARTLWTKKIAVALEKGGRPSWNKQIAADNEAATQSRRVKTQYASYNIDRTAK